MIRLTRTRTSGAITRALRGKLRRNKERKLLDGWQVHAGQIPSTYWKGKKYWKRAKAQLRKETHGKCAYCEADTSVVAHGDVEHYRPKSIYWWLAYCYDNFLFACQLCNETYKRDSFPIGGQRRLPAPAVSLDARPAAFDEVAGSLAPDPLDSDALTRFHESARTERPSIPDPYTLDPEPLFAWIPDDVLREVVLQPRDPHDATHQRAYRAAVDHLGLNRAELRLLRYQLYRKLRTLLGVVREARLSHQLRDQARDLLKEMTCDSHAFAGMARYFVRTWGVDLNA